VVSRLGLEPRALALKGDLTPRLNTTHPELSHISVHPSLPDSGLYGGLLGWVHGQNTDSVRLVCPVLVAVWEQTRGSMDVDPCVRNYFQRLASLTGQGMLSC